MKPVTYTIAPRGLGTEFSKSNQPIEYARRLTNRFINIKGEAEKRPGLKPIYPDIATTGGLQKIDLMAEHVAKDGSSILLTSQIFNDPNYDSQDYRRLYRYSTTANAWALIDDLDMSLDLAMEGKFDNITPTLSQKAYAVQFDDKTVIVAGDIRPHFYNSEKNKAFKLVSKLETGTLGSGTTTTIVKDTQVTDWLSQTFVNNNDIFYNISKDAYGVVTSVGTGNIDVTPISTSAAGIGLSNPTDQASGDLYEIFDAVDLNVIPRSTTFNVTELDNTAIAGAGTTSNVIVVSGVDFSLTDIRVNDYIYNTTRNALAMVQKVSANIVIDRNNLDYVVSGQAAGDSLIFLKSAVPVADFAHVHYGRLYLIDNRDKKKVRVSGPNDAEDFTTSTQTLDSSSLNYGGKQPQGEELLTLGTFQRYLVAGGKRNVYLDEGTAPVADTTAAAADFSPVGLFSQGVVSRKSLVNIGSDMLFSANDGMRQFRLSDILAVDTDNISEAIKTELRNAIRSQASINPDNIQAIHYPRRNWVMLKVGNVIYNFNYTPVYINGELARTGSWSKFTGRLAECNEYLVQANGDMLCVYHDTSANVSKFYEFDTGSYDDAGEPIVTDYEAAWIGTDDGRVLDGRYIKPYIEAYSNTNYTIEARSDLETNLLDDSVIVSASGGTPIGDAVVGTAVVGGFAQVNEVKYPLRWRGEQVQIRITTSAGKGADTISKFILYVNEFGRE